MSEITIGAMLLNLGVNTFFDIRARRISLVVCLATTAVAFFARLISGDLNMPSLVLAVAPGLIMLLVSIFTKGKVGLGDGVLLVCLGLLVRIDVVLEVLLLALGLSCVWSMVLLLRGKASLSSTLPLVPFMFAAYLFVLFMGF